MQGAQIKNKSEKIDFITLQQQVQQSYERIKELEAKLADREFQIAQLQKVVFGQTSERTKIKDIPAEGQLSFLDTVQEEQKPEEAVVDQKEADKDKSRKPKRGRRKVNFNLPTEEIIIRAPEEARKDADGNEFPVIGYETSEKITIRPARVWRVVFKREILGYKDSREVVFVTPHWPSIIAKGKLTDEFIHHLLVEKYFKAVPLYREMQKLNSQGADLSKSTVSDAVKRSALFYAPIAEAIRRQILTHQYIHGDETTIRRQDKERCHIGYMWALKDWRQVYFKYAEGRGRINLEEILQQSTGPPGEEKYYTGYLMADDYSAYGYICDKSGASRMACWAHVRRKFYELEKVNELAREFVALINELYKVEKQARKARDNKKLNDKKYHDLRYNQRQEKSSKVIEQIFQKIKDDELKTTPGSRLGKAMNYCRKLMPYLKVYLTDGRLPIDNNPVERSIRPVVIGRKNWLFVGSEDAGSWAAVHYTLMESCRLQNLDPYEYLKIATKKIHNAGSQVDYAQLTPYALRKSIPKIPTNFCNRPVMPLAF